MNMKSLCLEKGLGLSCMEDHLRNNLKLQGCRGVTKKDRSKNIKILMTLHQKKQYRHGRANGRQISDQGRACVSKGYGPPRSGDINLQKGREREKQTI